MFGIVEVDPQPEGPGDASCEDAGPREGRVPVFHLLPENEAVWELWLRVQTQWRIDAEGYPTGLDYASVAARMGRIAPRRRARLFDDIHAMELVTLEEASERRARRRREAARERR